MSDFKILPWLGVGDFQPANTSWSRSTLELGTPAIFVYSSFPGRYNYGYRLEEGRSALGWISCDGRVVMMEDSRVAAAFCLRLHDISLTEEKVLTIASPLSRPFLIGNEDSTFGEIVELGKESSWLMSFGPELLKAEVFVANFDYDLRSPRAGFASMELRVTVGRDSPPE